MTRSFARPTTSRPVAAGLLVLLAAAACRTASRGATPASIPPAAAADASRPAAADARPADARPPAAAADVQFVQRMIGHHAQALVMTDLVPARSRRDDVRLLAQRIEVSQRDELALMRRWLEQRGAPVPGPEAHHEHQAHHAAAGAQASMPGMLTREELARLAAATGAAFDGLFLTFMIRHHEGALTMVADLFATPGAGQEPELFRLASDVDADQRAEIRRLRTLQDAAPSATRRR